jgi:hypothetical protein
MTEAVQDANMVAIPPNTPFDPVAALVQWNEMQEQMKKLKVAEMALRKQLFTHYFPTPKEGTNTAPLSAGWVLKGGYPIERTVDIGAFNAGKELFAENGIAADSMVEFKPSLKKPEYNTLTAEQKNLFDRCLVVKPGSPSLKIVLPVKAKKAGETA